MTRRLSGLRIGTRLLLLLLVPTSALLVLTGIANWRDLQQVRQLAQFQQLVEIAAETSDATDAIARERAATVRARLMPSPSANLVRDARRAEVDRLMASASGTNQTTEAGDVGGQLDAVRRQLSALRLRSDTASVAAIDGGYRQALEQMNALARSLTGRPPTRDVTKTVIADLAIGSAIEAARREQLDVWVYLRQPERGVRAAAEAGQWEELERSGLNAFRSWAPSDAVAELNGVLFSPSGIAVRQRRAQLSRDGAMARRDEASGWWTASGTRLGGLGEIRARTRADVSAQIATDLAAARTSVLWRLAVSLLVVGVGLGLGILLRRSIARSLRELANSARALSSGQLDVVTGEDDADTRDDGVDEIAAVGDAFRAVRTTNQRLIAEVNTMNRAIATKQLTHRADATAFQGAWADVLAGLNGTMTEVARLQESEQREIDRQEVFGLVGRHVVSGEVTLSEAYSECCRLLVDHVGAARAEVYEETPDGWERAALSGAEAMPWPPGHTFDERFRREDARSAIIRRVGAAERGTSAVLVAEFRHGGPLDTADLLFVEGVVRLLDEAVNHRRSEIERMRTQKTEAAGTLAAAFAHDFNNVLGAILTNARLGELETDDAEAAETFKTIGGAVTRASEVVDRLLRFARTGAPRTDEFDLPALVEEACALVRPGLPARIELECEGCDGLPAVVGDPTRIHQVVVNLITNASQALGGSAGHIVVSVDEVMLSDDDLDGAPRSAAAGRYARVRVHDTGPGIPESIAKRIFDPFFTTKPEGQGTGLGLASALTIARDHGGTLDVSSIPGPGTTATLCLPIDRPEGRA